MKQVLIIHGGESYLSYDEYIYSLSQRQIDYEQLKPQKSWKSWIAEQMTDTDVLLPRFPNSDNADYDEWTLYFEKIIPYFGNDIQLVGHSLGAMFLAKYLNEKTLTQRVRRLILIAGMHDDNTAVGCGSFAAKDATGLEKSAEQVHLFHSEDDLVVPFSELAKFQADIPDAITHTFTDRGHFNDETFPEVFELLKQK